MASLINQLNSEQNKKSVYKQTGDKISLLLLWENSTNKDWEMRWEAPKKVIKLSLNYSFLLHHSWSLFLQSQIP